MNTFIEIVRMNYAGERTNTNTSSLVRERDRENMRRKDEKEL